MKKTLANGAIYTIAQVLFDQNGFRFNKNIKTRMAVRQALKVNTAEIEIKNKLIGEMINEIVAEVRDEFVQASKATVSGEEFVIADKTDEAEFMDEINRKIHELEIQTMDLELKEIPQQELDLYLERNDGEFTDAELDVLELFLKDEDDVNE